MTDNSAVKAHQDSMRDLAREEDKLRAETRIALLKRIGSNDVSPLMTKELGETYGILAGTKNISMGSTAVL